MDFIKENWAETLIMIGGILGFLFGLFVMVIEHYRLMPNKKTWGFLICLAGVLTTLGGFFSSTDNNDKQKKIILANKMIDSLSRLNNTLSSANSEKLDISLNKLNHIISESERVLVSLKKESRKINELQRLNEKIQNNQMGGDTYPIFTFDRSLRQPNSNLMQVYISLKAPQMNNDETFSLRSFSFEITDRFILSSLLRKNEFFTSSEIVLSRSIDILKKGFIHPIGEIPYQIGRDSLNYIINSNAENGRFTQFMILVKKENRWHYATIVKKHEGIRENILYQYAEAGFPISIEKVKFH